MSKIYNTTVMKKLTKLTFAILAFTLLFTACSKNDDDIPPQNKKLAKVIYRQNVNSTKVLNYKYDANGRLIQIDADDTTMPFIKINYISTDQIGRIEFPSNDMSFDYTYTGNSPLPNSIYIEEGSHHATADITFIDGNLNFKTFDIDRTLTAVNTTDRSFKSIIDGLSSFQFFYDHTKKNGLGDQKALNIPIALTGNIEVLYLLQLNDQVINGIQLSNGNAQTLEFEYDTEGYITKTKDGKIEYFYQ